VDKSGDAYVTGYTTSTDFPTVNPFQPTFGGNYDAFVTKFDPSGSDLVYSTYLGGSGTDYGNGIAVDDSGDAYVTGETTSTDFPTMNPFQPTCAGGCYDAFVAQLNAAGSALVYSTYLGGSGLDGGIGIAVDCTVPATIQVSGATPANVPVTVNTTVSTAAGTFPYGNSPLGAMPIEVTMFLFAPGFLLAANRRRSPALAVAVLALGFISLAGCGGSSSSSSSSSSGTPPNTYTVTVTATSGSFSSKTNLTVIVQ
jgi:hypothetical protein